jgi:hypothetical protein
MPLTATAGISAYAHYVELFADGGTAPYTWEAFPTGADPYTVPATTSDPTGRVTVDGYAPLGRDVLYRVTDATGATAEPPIMNVPDPGAPVLSHATDPTRWQLVAVADQLPNEWAARSVWFDVLDRRDPFVATAPLRLRNGDVVLYLPDLAARGPLLDLLADGVPLLLRSPCTAAVDDVVMLVTGVREELAVPDRKAGARLVTLTYQAVTRDLGPYLPDPTWTWADLVADTRLPTWAQVPPSFATWADVVSNVRAP